ncbi:MAG: hypothetical protein NC301_05700 [Bacteroides sp.]|nr:hypothetical protein [Bacteroides sp.]MCM1379233.1 hypothetical protein [Bacteroides sp.]MCM1445109.1 hypothetical protein [Prevotella sp.]
MESIKLNSGAKVKLFPSAIVVYNFSDGDDADGKLAQILSSHPGESVVFINTKYSPEVFEQAETRNRAFIFDRTKINPDCVDPEFPAQWVSEGDFLPGLPGNLSLEASAEGLRVTSLPPDAHHTALFT